MSNPEQQAGSVLQSLEKLGFTDSVVTSLRGLIAEFDDIIQAGENEYGGSTVSTSESRRYEQAVIARRIVVQSLMQRKNAENMSIIHSILDQFKIGGLPGGPADLSVAVA